MKLPRNILLLLPTILVISCYEASSLFHPLPAASSSSSLYWSTSRKRRNRHITFMTVPRGGFSTYDNDIDANVSDAEDPTKNNLHDDCLNIYIFDDDTENNIDEDDYYVASYENDEDDYDHLPARIDPNILSPTHLTSLFLSAARHRQSLTSAMVLYTSRVIRATRRACLAGARAVMSLEDDDDEDCKVQCSGASSNGESASEAKRGGGGNKPMVHTLIGRTVHVLGDMYRAATTSDNGSDVLGNEMAEQSNEDKQRENDEEEESCLGTKRSRRRRRHRRQRNENRCHNRHRHLEHHWHGSTPQKAIQVIGNGGGMDPPPPPHHDAIIQLAKVYNTKLSTSDDDANRPSLSNKYNSILLSSQTSINEALQMANSNARFLICYISKRSNKSNTIAIPNLISPDIVKLANRKALGKKQSGEYASFYIWIANDDAHVDAAMKRLGVKPLKRQSTKKKSSSSSKSSADAPPILAIVYPSNTIDPSSGRPRISSRVLAQHHCNPPPTTTEILTSWANTVRKRHLREYAKLQHTCTELRLLKERNRGYVGSIQEDEAREAREGKERQQKEEEEANERDRLRQIDERRQVLLESLAEEPPAGTTPSEDVITIALRFIDGSTKPDQRRFLADETTINDVFNWIDATHGIEREKLELSTMNGARKFVYTENNEDDLTLREAGLAKMTALRVSVLKAAVDNSAGNEIAIEEDDEEENEGDDDEGAADEEDDEEEED